MRKTKPQSFSCTQEDWEGLVQPANKLGLSRNLLIQKLVRDFLKTGKIEPQKTQSHESTNPQQHPSTDSKLKKLKVADLTLKVWDKLNHAGYTLKQFDSFVNDGVLAYPENKTFQPEPIVESTKPQQLQFKNLGTTVTHQPKKILQEDGSLRCKRCNRHFDMRAFDFEQLDDYRKHVEEVHGKLENTERMELLEIYPN